MIHVWEVSGPAEFHHCLHDVALRSANITIAKVAVGLRFIYWVSCDLHLQLLKPYMLHLMLSYNASCDLQFQEEIVGSSTIQASLNI